ncbi:MAG TPA: hypothetical protein VN620_02775 [Candidatus Methylomirabilis sp.]|nr:hypothetical protein [Candidatus Methylomirabilis sp.]
MRTRLILTLVFFISCAWLRAESAGPASDKSQKSADLTTLQGCLHTDRSQYILTEANGTSHALSGAAKQLGRLVRHEVEVAGKPGVRTIDTTSAGGASSVLQYAVFEVKTVKDLAPECKSPAH